LGRSRLVAAVVLIAIVPLCLQLPALAALALVFVTMGVLVAYEAIQFADVRGGSVGT
jgi:hypothetical protein